MIRKIVLLIYISTLLGSPSYADTREGLLLEAMTNELSCYPLELLYFSKQQPLIKTKDICLSVIYHETGGQPLWVGVDGVGDRAAVILDYLARSDLEGLDPSDYEVDELQRLWNAREVQQLARLDTLLTYNLVKYIHDMSYGQIKYRAVDPALFAEAGNEEFDPFAAIDTAMKIPDLKKYLESLAPRHQYYENLKEALRYYRALAKQNDFERIGGGKLIRPGDTDTRLVPIQKLLMTKKELGEDHQLVESYSPELVRAVTGFQSKYGLEPDGIIGPKTLGAMNLSFGELIMKIRVNMARWRWHAHELGDNYILVNIAGFTLKAVRNGQLRLEVPVIVGKYQHQTPVFSNLIRYLDFNPYWNVPPSIARNEELPALRRDRNHLVERNIRLFSGWQPDAVELDSTAIDWQKVSRAQMSRYKLRQEPGPENALGRVKFVFPNRYMVYLHDTPARELFEHSKRSFSHGCIRVSNPLALASFLLQGQDGEFTAENFEEIEGLEKRKIVRLAEPFPIHITYQTAWVDKNNQIHFNSDVYGRDAKLMQALLQ
ncbi:L,D-transpeptidase family protein [Desulforhopalus singaporensis]|uniref:Murein L,D-transpeptidase YcbB/YkuD n=1 Tax=Desulforhopalus singaporensis TaxID=91360 RepID=A0A1H0KCT4_9BACT|nr:L,D-transpeptidase family protein [Desulforhopalus singaporensis]SDO53653.1 Murein L,D-transpeptidase YcbB/YkuD [Desulforhopalus singaporensis]